MDLKEKKTKHIDRLKAGVSKTIPERDTLSAILEQERPGLTETIEKQEKLDGQKVIDTVNEIAKLLYETDVTAAEKYGGYISLTKEEMLELAKISFDILKYKNQTENMYILSRQFLLGAKRVNDAVLSKIFSLINESKYKDAVATKKKYQKVIKREMQEKYGKQYFEKVMTFDTSRIEREYDNAFWIKQIYGLDKKTVTHPAEIQFEFSIKHERYSIAVDLAEKFDLSQEKTFKAVTLVFKERFTEFLEKFDKKEYSGKVKFTNDDPYKTATDLIKKHKILGKEVKSREAQEFGKEIKDTAYTFLKKLVHFEDYKNLDLELKSFFCLNLITDFNLLDSADKARYDECAGISDNLLNNIEENIKSLSDARNYHEVVVKIYEQSPVQKITAKKIGTRIFEIYLDNNQLKQMREIYEALKLELKDVFTSLKKKSIDCLEANDLELFKKLTGLFNIMHNLNSSNEFLKSVFHVYREAVYADDIITALELTKMFKMSSNKKLEPIKQKLLEYFIHNKDAEAIKIMKAFHIKNSQISDTLLTIYRRRSAKSSKLGVQFRNKLNISIGDIGFMTWFFTEVLKVSGFKK